MRLPFAAKAMNYRIQSAVPLIHVQLGPMMPTVADLRLTLDTIASDPRFRPGLSVLIEGGHLYVDRTLQREGLLLLASRLAVNTDVQRWALHTGNLATYCERRSVEVYAQGLGIEYRVFVRRRDSLNWLLSLAGACSA